MSTSPNPFLSGNFAPSTEEVVTECTPLEGKVPTDIEGSFLRNGPNPDLEPAIPGLYHPFDGDGMVHSLSFEGGRLTYRNRWIETAGLQREREAGKALWGGFLSAGKVMPPADMPAKNAANTALVWHAGRLLALFEGGSPHELELPSLRTTGVEDFEGGWRGNFTAHPTVDPGTDEMVTFSYSLGQRPPYVRYGVVNAEGKLVHQTGIDLPKPVMIHDIAITPSYSLILDLPVTISMERMMRGGMAFDWEPENGARIGVIPRFGQGSEVRWFEIELGYIYHVFNAWEEGSEIVLDACRSGYTKILTKTDEPDPEEQAKYHQYRLDLETGEVREQQIDDTQIEFSRINENFTGQKNRYGYASRFIQGENIDLLFNGLVKYDREKRGPEVLELGPNRYTQEFVFAPRVHSQSEDDGYLVGLVRDEQAQRSECWLIDAQRFSEGPVARFEIPVRVPYGFHSQWVPGEKIAAQRLRLQDISPAS